MAHQPLRYDFDSVATTYDQWYETAEGNMYDRLEKKAISKYLPQNVSGMKLLEIGCGTGHWSQFFASLGFEVTGIDISDSMIKIAQSKALSHVSFQVADAHALPFDDSSFNVTAAITTIEFVQDYESVLREMLRCTNKPGGQILLGVLNASAQINRQRRENPESLYAKARWFTPRQIEELLEPLGRVSVATVGFIPRWMPMLQWSSLIDRIGSLLRLPYGAFIAAKVMI
ncbi:class I SAM-dependent methyltransferase [Planctomycetota bacterium]